MKALPKPPIASDRFLFATLVTGLAPVSALDFDSTYFFRYTLPLHMARALPIDGPEANAALSRGYYYAYTRPSGSGWPAAWTLRAGW